MHPHRSRSRPHMPPAVRRFLPLLALLGAALSAGAQSVITGTVTAARSKDPIDAATVVVEGTQRGALTGSVGTYRIVNVPPGTYRLTARRIGYAPVTKPVTVATGTVTVDFALERTATTLEEIVVTGTPLEQTKRQLGNAVGTVKATEIQQVAPEPDVQHLLNAVPGVRVQPAGGDVGSGGNTRIRGANSMTLASEPLIYIDGVRVNNAFADAGAFAGVGVDSRYPPSRINDMNPDEIESIEIIKGPAAATLYGTEASNGVINIITKKGGGGGRASLSYQARTGANWLPDPESFFQHSYYKTASGQIVDADVLGHDRTVGFPVSYYGYCPKPYAQSGTVCKGSPFSTGALQAYEGTLSGSSDALNFFFFGGWDHDQGAVDYNWKNRFSGRSNLTYAPNERIKLDVGIGYTRGKIRSAGAQQPITTGILWSCPSPGCEPGKNLPNGLDGALRGYLLYVPEVYEDNIQGYEDLDRNTITSTLTHRPFGWLTQRLTVGADNTDQTLSSLWKKITTVGSLFPNGRRDVENTNTSFASADYAAAARAQPFQALGLETAVGFQYYQKKYESSYAHAETFPVGNLETISAGAVRTSQESFLENKTVGAYVQEQAKWNDRLYLTAALRGDDNSAFGKSYKATRYPKFSAAYVVSDEPWAKRVPGLSSLKLRSAWGEAGQQPDAFAALRTYAPATGANGVPTLTPQNLGNTDLRPELGKELEAGFDASLFDGRLGAEFTWYNKQTKDALVQVPALPSLGFPGVQFRNIGEVDNRGIEMGLNANVYASAATDFSLAFKFSHNANKVATLGGTPSLVMNATFGQYHVPGYPLGSIFQTRILSAQIDSSGPAKKVVNMMCESGDKLPGTNFSAGGGPPVPCAQAPAVYWGNPLPSWEGSVAPTLTLFKNLQLYALVDFLGGNTILSGDIRASLLSFRNQITILQQTDPILMGYDVLDTRRQPGIVKGGFSKLRQISATYSLPATWLQRHRLSRASATISAENLFTLWVAQRSDFGVKLTDPEIRNSAPNGSDPGGLLGYNQEGWPQLHRVVVSLRVTP